MGGGGGVKGITGSLTGMTKPKEFLKAAADPIYGTKKAWNGQEVETPTISNEDPNAAANEAANAAARAANAKLASKKKRKSLLASGATGVEGSGNSVLANASGKKTLGA